MYKVALVNPAFSRIEVPSMALAKLTTIVHESLGESVDIKTFNINMDVADYCGHELYAWISYSNESFTSGLGEWFFREAAFPEAKDNTEMYLQRYWTGKSHGEAEIPRVLEKRAGADNLLDEIIDKYQLETYAMIGMTTMFAQNVACLALARKIKERNADILISIGGSNCEPPMGWQLAKECPNIDFVFCGSAQRSFPTVLSECIRGVPVQSIAVQGVHSKYQAIQADASIPDDDLQATTRMCWEGNRLGEEQDINEGCIADYEPFLDELFRRYPDGQVDPILPFMTSRGCYHWKEGRCRFCSLNGTELGYKAMSPDVAVRELQSVYRYFPRCKRFQGVDNVMPPFYSKNVLPISPAPEGSMIFYEVRAHLQDEQLAPMSKCGVKLVQIGVEALSTPVLKLLRKGTTAFENIAILKKCLEHDIYSVWILLLGIPGQLEDCYRRYCELMPLLEHLVPPAVVTGLRFERFSNYFENQREHGLRCVPADFYGMVYPFNERTLNRIGYQFTDTCTESPYYRDQIKWLGPLHEQYNIWKSQWSEWENGTFPHLYLESEGSRTIVRDTRSRGGGDHELSPLLLQVLEELSAPQSTDELCRKFPSVSEQEICDACKELSKEGLVFQEEDTYLSLVFQKRPQPPSWRLHCEKPLPKDERLPASGTPKPPKLVSLPRRPVQDI